MLTTSTGNSTIGVATNHSRVGSADSPEAKEHYSAIEITPHFIATWKP